MHLEGTALRTDCNCPLSHRTPCPQVCGRGISQQPGGRAGSRRDGPLIRGPRLLGVSVSSHPNPTARPPRTVCARGPWAWCLRTGARVLGAFT